LKFEVTFKETCVDFWQCLNPADWLQVIAVSIAALAAIASLLAVYITRKQFREESEERRKKYKPFFKIKALNGSDDNGNVNWFTIVNEGFPFYVINDVKWTGEGVVIKNHFNGMVENKKNNLVTEKYETFAIILEITNITEAFEGYVEISGLDMEHNLFVLKTPLIKIKNGQIENDVDLTYQYLR
jgi:hypothetical protein